MNFYEKEFHILKPDMIDFPNLVRLLEFQQDLKAIMGYYFYWVSDEQRDKSYKHLRVSFLTYDNYFVLGYDIEEVLGFVEREN